jgi:hypothetical protein
MSVLTCRPSEPQQASRGAEEARGDDYDGGRGRQEAVLHQAWIGQVRSDTH